MFDAFHRDVIAQHLAEHVPFGAADSRARAGGFADGAVPFDEEIAVGALTHGFSHVALFGPYARQCSDAGPDRSVGYRDAAPVGVDLCVGTDVDDATQSVVTDRGAHGVDDLDRELRVVIGEQRTRRVGDGPRDGWSTAGRGGPRGGRHECIGLERGEVLAHCDVGEPECRRELADRGGLPPLQLVEHPPLRGADRGGRHAPSIGVQARFPKAHT